MTTSSETTKDSKIVTAIGRVKSDKMDKTIVIRVERRLMHPLYKKIIKRFTTLVAHDEANEAKEGDTVEVVFTRPTSKRKRWRLVRIIDVAKGGEGASGADDASGADK